MNLNLKKISLKCLFVYIFSLGIVTSLAQTASDINISTTTPNYKFIKIIDSCNYGFAGGGCVAARAEPTVNSKKIARLRNGVVLKVTEIVNSTSSNPVNIWYKVSFLSEKIAYPERSSSTWYINSKYAVPVLDIKTEVYNPNKVYLESQNKSILVDISDQTLYAYENNALFLKTKISTGLQDTPTIPGEYYIQNKTPSRYMQGPDKLASTTPSIVTSTTTGYYDLPGVPWTMYFSDDGSAIHGAYWHNRFGKLHSHGCVNVNLKDAEKLYRWAGVSTSVIVRD